MTRPKILLLGSGGQVGWELRDTLTPLGQVLAPQRQELDLTAPDGIIRKIREIKPSLIVNAAAHTAVDRAEAEPELAHRVNAEAPGILAEEAKRIGAFLVHYSTDYVFDGSATAPYREDDPTNPRSVYGRSKLLGERAIQEVGGAHLIFRTSWVYGWRGRNFLLTMLGLARKGGEIRVVADQFGAPTWSRMIAETTALALARWRERGAERQGVYHMTAGGIATWHEFARAILQAAPQSLQTREATPITTEEYPTPAERPRYSVLSNEKLERDFGLALPHWRDTFQRVLEWRTHPL